MATQVRIAAAPALWGGLGVALVLLAMPVGLVETVVASSGLSEAWPAAAPPLGLKARLSLAGFGALMAIGFAWAGQQSGGLAPPHGLDNGRRNGASGVKKMGFALSKLSWLARRNAGSSRSARPALRRADAHPDAPARAPIFASRDFGGLDIFPRPTSARQEETEQPIVLALPSVAPAPPADMIDAEFEEIPTQEVAPAARPAPISRQPQSITELTARLERGLAQRARTARGSGSTAAVLADMPVERPIPVRDQVEEDVDQALRAALSTLRSMADRTR